MSDWNKRWEQGARFVFGDGDGGFSRPSGVGYGVGAGDYDEGEWAFQFSDCCPIFYDTEPLQAYELLASLEEDFDTEGMALNELSLIVDDENGEPY